eukprot:10360483-Heterocapsa_arctica.AAC.1
MRGMLAQEARHQERKAEGAALLGIPYVPPRTHLAAPAKAVGLTPLAQFAQGLVASQGDVPPTGPPPMQCSWIPPP